MAKRKPRRLWLNIFFKVPKGISRQTVLRTLIASIEDGTYEYPKSWSVVIEWRNKEHAEMKPGEFTREMRKSSAASSGWDTAVTQYLENQL